MHKYGQILKISTLHDTPILKKLVVNHFYNLRRDLVTEVLLIPPHTRSQARTANTSGNMCSVVETKNI